MYVETKLVYRAERKECARDWSKSFISLRSHIQSIVTIACKHTPFFLIIGKNNVFCRDTKTLRLETGSLSTTALS